MTITAEQLIKPTWVWLKRQFRDLGSALGTSPFSLKHLARAKIIGIHFIDLLRFVALNHQDNLVKLFLNY